MPIEPAPIRAEARPRAAQERIKRYIVENQLQPGDPIPTEQALARTLGISRNSLREALRALETAGVVETRHGLGTFVGEATLAPLIAGMAFSLVQSISREPRTLGEMLEVREIIEAELVRRAAGRHTPAQLARLERLVARMETQGARGRFDREADRDFHDVLYEPLGNRVVILVLEAFWDVLRTVEAQLPDTDFKPTTNAQWHRDILDAVRAGDEDAAVAAMRVHFAGIQERLERHEHGASDE
ncbi:MAG: FadR/GntR family transcriptional regulator [Thermomicrobiales bacterium]